MRIFSIMVVGIFFGVLLNGMEMQHQKARPAPLIIPQTELVKRPSSRHKLDNRDFRFAAPQSAEDAITISYGRYQGEWQTYVVSRSLFASNFKMVAPHDPILSMKVSSDELYFILRVLYLSQSDSAQLEEFLRHHISLEFPLHLNDPYLQQLDESGYANDIIYNTIARLIVNELSSTSSSEDIFPTAVTIDCFDQHTVAEPYFCEGSIIREFYLRHGRLLDDPQVLRDQAALRVGLDIDRHYPSGYFTISDLMSLGHTALQLLEVDDEVILDLSYERTQPLRLKSLEGLSDIKGFERITTIRLSGHALVTLKASVFAGCEQLRSLIIDDCRLCQVDGDVCLSLPCLRTLNLRANKLTGIPSISSQITDLDLSGNNIQWIEDDVFEQTKGLKRIVLTGNPLRGVYEEAFKALSLGCTLIFHDIQETITDGGIRFGTFLARYKDYYIGNKHPDELYFDFNDSDEGEESSHGGMLSESPHE